MAQKTHIEWTDATWNPVTGCTKISPGCTHCYAEVFAERFRGVPGHPYEQGFDLKLWPSRLNQPRQWKRSRVIFVNSMSDLFHEQVPDDFVKSVFETMIACPQHVFQVLTKRPGRMKAFFELHREFLSLAESAPHIWLGVSIESQRYVERATVLLSIESSVRFLSCEPLLGPLDLKSFIGLNKINWVIAGGESGHGARPMEADWVRELQKTCENALVPFFFKQWGGVQKKKNGRILDGRLWDESPLRSRIAVR